MDTLVAWVFELLGSPEFTALLLTTFAGVVTAFVGWVGVQFRRRILRDLSSGDLALLRSIATIAVQYVEQRYIAQNGPTKLQAAIVAANTMIASYGLTVSIEQLTAIVEAAVYAEIAKVELPAPPPEG
jgi:hypothetical protein